MNLMTDLAVTVKKLVSERLEAKQSPLPVVYEDNHLLAVCKYPFVLSQADGSSKLETLNLERMYIRQESERQGRPKLGNIYLVACHRLDYTVGGVLLLAKTEKTAKRMQSAIKSRQLAKSYIAITEANHLALAKLKAKEIEEGLYHLENYLAKDEEHLKARIWQASSSNVPVNYKKASLTMRLLAEYKDAFIWQISLETGRFHQIRAQLANVNLPLLGDYKYNQAQAQKSTFVSPLLWAYELEFEHPVKKINVKLQAWPEAFCFQAYANFPYADYLAIRSNH